MIPLETTIRFVLSELYNKLCNCIRDSEEQEDFLNPHFHKEGCLYKIAVEKETNIKWTKEPTQDS